MYRSRNNIVRDALRPAHRVKCEFWIDVFLFSALSIFTICLYLHFMPIKKRCSVLSWCGIGYEPKRLVYAHKSLLFVLFGCHFGHVATERKERNQMRITQKTQSLLSIRAHILLCFDLICSHGDMCIVHAFHH